MTTTLIVNVKYNLNLPALSCLRTSHTLQLKSSYPPSNRRPDLEKATDVIPHIMLSWEYIPISWSARISNKRHVASSDPVAKAYPFGKYCKKKEIYNALKGHYEFTKIIDSNINSSIRNHKSWDFYLKAS